MTWEGNNKLLIVRGPDGKPTATIAVSEDGNAFATVTHGGKTSRMNHTDVGAAQAWCLDLLAGTRLPPPTDPKQDVHVAAMGLRPRGGTNPRPASPPPTPKGAPLERLLAVLRKDPKLAWELTKTLVVLRPWNFLPERPEDQGRLDCHGVIKARLTANSTRYTLHFTTPLGKAKSFDLAGEDITERADAILDAEGFVLLTEEP